MAAPRVLQVIGDTDPAPEHLAALELHDVIAREGLEVRTLALAPGSRGGLEDRVPAIAPARRSIAARSGLRSESRWADVIVLHAPRALTPAAVPPSELPHVVAYHDVPRGRTVRRWSVEPRLVTTAGAVVVPDEDRARRLALRVGDPRLEAHVVAPADRAWAEILVGVLRRR